MEKNKKNHQQENNIDFNKIFEWFNSIHIDEKKELWNKILQYCNQKLPAETGLHLILNEFKKIYYKNK